MTFKKVVLVTGGAGYVGSVLIPELMKNNYKVKCLDRFFFGMDHLHPEKYSGKLELIRDDIRWFEPKILKDVDVVIDLAAISNDPAGELDSDKTYDINYLGRSRVSRLSKKFGVKHYILASSASNYGFTEDIVTEESQLNPLTTYSKANVLAEKDILPLNDSDFSVTILRFSSLFGYSPRIRFDLALNIMTLDLFKTGVITVGGDGKQVRPLMHVLDAAKTYLKILASDKDKISGEIYNVGSDDQNYQLKDLAENIGQAIGKKYEIQYKGSPDHRSYKMSSLKIKREIGFEPEHDISFGANEIYSHLENGVLKDTIKTRTVEWYKTLLEADRLVKEVGMRDTIL